MNLLIAAMSGWGKSHAAQEKMEKNLPRTDFAAVFDPKDEYRGLVEAGLCKWAIAGPKEHRKGPDYWFDLFIKNRRLVIPRYLLSNEEWQKVVADCAEAIRRLYTDVKGQPVILVGIDEAHIVAPNMESYPKAVKLVASMGRGEGVSAIWITQRPSMLDTDIRGNCEGKYLGGFTTKADLENIPVEYPHDIHNPQLNDAAGNPLETMNLPDALKVDGRSIALRKWLTDDEGVAGSEWIYSNEAGELRREDRRNIDMSTTHYGHSGWRLTI